MWLEGKREAMEEPGQMLVSLNRAVVLSLVNR